jgi:chromosome segregation ATPase
MKTTTLTQQQIDPAERLLSLETDLSDNKVHLAESQQRIVAARSELADLLLARTSLDASRAPLKQAHADALGKVEEALQALTRHRGRSTESLYGGRLAEAQQSVATVAAKLADYDAQSGVTANEARATELQGLISKEEAALHKSETTLKDLQSTYDAAFQALGQSQYEQMRRQLSLLDGHVKAESDVLAELRNDHAHLIGSIGKELARWPLLADALRKEYGRMSDSSLSEVLQSYLDFLDVIESNGVVLSRIRLDDAVEWNTLLALLMIWPNDISDWFASLGDVRLGLKERQDTIRQHLKRLA